MRFTFIFLILFSSFIFKSKAQNADELRLSFGFSKMELYKISYNAKDIIPADINGDGLQDLVLVDNKKAKIEFLIQCKTPPATKVDTTRPINERELEDQSFQREGFYTEKWVKSLAVGDLNGDKKLDLVIADDQKNIFVYYQKGNVTFSTSNKLSTKGKSVLVHDFSNDGRDDLVVAQDSSFSLWIQNKAGTFEEPQDYQNIKFGAYYHGDFNNDQKSDLIFLRGNQEHAVSVRFMSAEGTFGPEVSFELAQPKAILPIQLPKVAGWNLVSLGAKNPTVKLYQCGLQSSTEKKKFHFGSLRVYPYQNGGSLSRDASLIDIDEDKLTDIVLNDPATSQIKVYSQSAGGNFSKIQDYSSLVELNGIVPGHFRNATQTELLITSQKEHSLGLSLREKSGRISFPSFIPTTDKLVLANKGNLCGDAKDEIIYITAGKSRDYFLKILSYENNAFVEKLSLPLPKSEVSSRPRELHVEDINGDGKLDFLITLSMKPLFILLNQGELKFKNLAENPNFRKSLISNIGVGALTIDDLDQDGKKEILFCQKNFVRVITVDAQDNLHVLEQFNGSQASSEIIGACVGNFNEDPALELALYNKSSNSIDLLEKQKDGSYKFVQELSIGSFQFRGMQAADLSGDGKQDIFLLGKKKFGIIFNGKEELKFSLLNTHMSEIQNSEARFTTMTAGDFNNDSELDLAVVESTKNYIVFLTINKENKIRHARKFKVFHIDQLNSKRQQKLNEPRELAQGDFNNDGKTDLVALIHDRVIFYFQE